MSALSRLLGAPCVMALLAPAALPAVPLDLAFLPPAVEEQSLCGRAAAERRVDDGSPGDEDALTEMERARYLQRDIRRYQSADPDRHFDFIATLRARLSSADARFSGAAELIDLIGLHIDAGRFDAL
ncbi:hypothetical protein, partial [Marinovum algicola]